ncbi:MAG: Asr1405/Asl0597 family protein [Synechococcus sp.]
MMDIPGAKPELSMQAIAVPRQDRWRVRQRLLELAIPAVCSDDGHLHVEVRSSVAALQVRSVLRQFSAHRSELVDWLETCWLQASPDRAS